MARLLYTLSILALLPWALLHLVWRARRQPDYLRHWGERFGFFAAAPAAPLIWIHAVSVGETRAAQPLVAALKERYPGHRILMTHMTPTGRHTSESVFGSQVERCYLPYDTPWAVARFLAHFRPAIGIIMETEIWPNLVAGCHERAIPLLLINARLSARSARRYGRFPRITAETLAKLAAITAIGEDDATRLRNLGAPGVTVCGHIKFDIDPPAGQIAKGDEFRRLCGDRPVLLCASTREGEERLILDAWAPLRGRGMLLALVPRHPQRFDEVARLAVDAGFKVARRSTNTPVPSDADIWIGDSMGEMFAYYAAADAAFIGGSLLEYGSQNLIEACAVGTPVLIGPSTFNFPDTAKAAVTCGAALQIADGKELAAQAAELLRNQDRLTAMGTAGKAFAASHRGATARNLALIEPFIPAGR